MKNVELTSEEIIEALEIGRNDEESEDYLKVALATKVQQKNE